MSKTTEVVDKLIPDEPVDNEERRKLLHFAARFLITVFQFCLLVLMLILLFYQLVPEGSRDLISAITGMLVISQKDAVQYWFHRNDNSL